MRNSTATSQSAATATTETFYPHTELLQPAQSQRQLQRAAPDAYTADEDEDDEMEYSEETIAKLLKEAEDRLHSKAAALNVNSAVASVSSPSPPALNLPKLSPGVLPKPYISTTGNGFHRTDTSSIPTALDRTLAQNPKSIDDPVLVKKRLLEEKEKTAGSDWFDLPRTKLTPEVKRDLQLIKLRGILDPKRHYKRDKTKGFPKYSQMGTIIEGNTEFFSSRLTKRARKETILEEVMANKDSTSRFKNKFNEIQISKKSGRKEYYKKMKEKRKSNK